MLAGKIKKSSKHNSIQRFSLGKYNFLFVQYSVRGCLPLFSVIFRLSNEETNSEDIISRQGRYMDSLSHSVRKFLLADR